MFRSFLLMFLTLMTLPLAAQSREGERLWLWGLGHDAIYDAYLSPLDYRGPVLTMTMEQETTVRADNERWMREGFFELTASTSTPTYGGRYYDAHLAGGMGYTARWFCCDRRLVLQAGGRAVLSVGGTYTPRNGNNPAQGRASLELAPVVKAAYAFRGPFRRQQRDWRVKVMAEAPLVGAAFAPRYGQSYFEIFSLGHYDRNIVISHPVVAPTARIVTTLHIPTTKRAELVVGYRGAAYQSRLNGIARHNWQNGLVVGYNLHL